MSDERQPPGTADHVGEAAGGIVGVVVGASIGSTAGPVGVLLGGVAGAIGGWWSGRALVEAAEDITSADDEYYRRDYERRAQPRESYDAMKGMYYLGDVAAANPHYTTFEDVERDLARRWNDATPIHGEWETVRGYASVGFQHGRDRRRKPR
jgi:hypothetical protein